jgi:hypothetical protein
LSNARKVAIEKARGLIIGYPDDDCLYYPDTISKVMSGFDNFHEEKIIFGKRK